MLNIKLGLSATALTVMSLLVLSLGSASAEVGANWKVKGANLTKVLLPSLGVKEIEKVSGTEEKYVGFLAAPFGTKVEFRCTGMAAVGAKLETEGA